MTCPNMGATWAPWLPWLRHDCHMIRACVVPACRPQALIKASREPPWGRGGQGWSEDRSSACCAVLCCAVRQRTPLHCACRELSRANHALVSDARSSCVTPACIGTGTGVRALAPHSPQSWHGSPTTCVSNLRA